MSIRFCALGIIQLNILTELGAAIIPAKVMLPHRCSLMVSAVGTIKKWYNVLSTVYTSNELSTKDKITTDEEITSRCKIF